MKSLYIPSWILKTCTFDYAIFQAVQQFDQVWIWKNSTLAWVCHNKMSFSTYAGALTGKYTPGNPPTGPRGRIYTPEFLAKVRLQN